MNVDGRAVLVSCPDVSSAGRLSVDLLAALSRARAERIPACVLRRAQTAQDALLALTTDAVPLVNPGDGADAWLRARWQAAVAGRRTATRLRATAASIWHEVYREFRRHAGDERLPARLRSRLRDLGRQSLARSVARAPRPVPYPRRLLRDPIKTALPPGLLEEARAAAAEIGIAAGRPIVAIDPGSRREAFGPAVDFLLQQGYGVVQLGAPLRPVLEVYVLLIARFVVSGSIERQQAAYLTNTPSLTLNAVDPFSAYPVRTNGLFALKRTIDLDTGRVLAPVDLLQEEYFRNLRNYGYRDNTPAEILDAIAEMHEGVTRGWRDTGAQGSFREAATSAGRALAARVPHVAQWGPDEGFLGEGRLARVQAGGAT